MVLIFWSFCIKAKGHTTDANGNKLRKEVYNDSLFLSGPLVEKEYRARFIATDGQPTALDSTLLLAQDSIVFKPGFHAQPGMRLTAKIDSTIVPVDQTDYIRGVEYRNGGIEAIYHPQGRAVPDGSTWQHEYVITDHLGNTRLRFSDLDGSGTIDNTELLSTHDYYPFGLEWQDGGYKYTYNGKEKNAEFGLDWLDYHNRWLDPVTGRWNGVDPLAEEMSEWSTYNYTFGNPIKFVDPDGLSPQWIPEFDKKTRTISYVAEDGDSYQTFVDQYGETAANEAFNSNCDQCFSKDETFSAGDIILSSDSPFKLIIKNKAKDNQILDFIGGGTGKMTTTDIQDVYNQLELAISMSEAKGDGTFSMSDFFVDEGGDQVGSFTVEGKVTLKGGYTFGRSAIDYSTVLDSKRSLPTTFVEENISDGFKREFRVGHKVPLLATFRTKKQ